MTNAINLEMLESEVRNRLIQSIPWHVAFAKAVKQMVPPDMFEEIMNAADQEFSNQREGES